MRGTVLMLAGPEYEDLEVWYPKLRLEEAGFATPLAGMGDASFTRLTPDWVYPSAVHRLPGPVG